MKIFKWSIVIVVLLIIAIVVGVWLNLNGIIKNVVEKQTSQQLDLKTTLGSAKLSLFGGSVSLSNLRIDSPKGFSAPTMFSLGDVAVAVNYTDLRKDPIRISDLAIHAPKLVIEQAGGKLNVQSIMDALPKTDPNAKPLNFIIDRLTLDSAAVSLRPGIPGLPAETNITLPPVVLENIGMGEGNRNGVALKQVVARVVSAMVEKAKDSDAIPAQLKPWLSLNADQLKTQMLSELSKQLNEKVGGEAGKVLNNVLKNPDALKDPAKSVEQGLKNLFDGGKKTPATQP